MECYPTKSVAGSIHTRRLAGPAFAQMKTGRDERNVLSQTGKLHPLFSDDRFQCLTVEAQVGELSTPVPMFAPKSIMVRGRKPAGGMWPLRKKSL